MSPDGFDLPEWDPGKFYMDPGRIHLPKEWIVDPVPFFLPRLRDDLIDDILIINERAMIKRAELKIKMLDITKEALEAEVKMRNEMIETVSKGT